MYGHDGGLVEAGDIRPGERLTDSEYWGTGIAPALWVDRTKTDLVAAIGLSSSGRSVIGLSTLARSPDGSRVLSGRSYTSVAGDEFDASSVDYDAMGRWKQATDATGTSDFREFDALGRVVRRSTGVGGVTSVIAEYEFQGAAGLDGRVTAVKTYPHAGEVRTTALTYDARNRPRTIVNPLPPHAAFAYDNLGARTQAALYADAGDLPLEDDAIVPGPNFLLGEATSLDAMRRVYDSVSYAADPEDPYAPRLIEHGVWYGPHGNVTLTTGETIEKRSYDQLCRPTECHILAATSDVPTNESARVVASPDIVLSSTYLFRDQVTGVVVAQAQIGRDVVHPALAPGQTGRLWIPNVSYTDQRPTHISLPGVRPFTLEALRVYNHGDLDEPTRVFDAGDPRRCGITDDQTICCGINCLPLPLDEGVEQHDTFYDEKNEPLMMMPRCEPGTEIRRNDRREPLYLAMFTLGPAPDYANEPPVECDPPTWCKFEYSAGRMVSMERGAGGPVRGPSGSRITRYHYADTLGGITPPSGLFPGGLPANNRLPLMMEMPDGGRYWQAPNQLGEVEGWQDPRGARVDLLRDALGRVTRSTETLPSLPEFDGLAKRREFEHAFDPLGRAISVEQFVPRHAGAGAPLDSVDSVSWAYSALGSVKRLQQLTALEAADPLVTGPTDVLRHRLDYEFQLLPFDVPPPAGVRGWHGERRYRELMFGWSGPSDALPDPASWSPCGIQDQAVPPFDHSPARPAIEPGIGTLIGRPEEMCCGLTGCELPISVEVHRSVTKPVDLLMVIPWVRDPNEKLPFDFEEETTPTWCSCALPTGDPNDTWPTPGCDGATQTPMGESRNDVILRMPSGWDAHAQDAGRPVFWRHGYVDCGGRIVGEREPIWNLPAMEPPPSVPPLPAVLPALDWSERKKRACNEKDAWWETGIGAEPGDFPENSARSGVGRGRASGLGGSGSRSHGGDAGRGPSPAEAPVWTDIVPARQPDTQRRQQYWDSDAFGNWERFDDLRSGASPMVDDGSNTGTFRPVSFADPDEVGRGDRRFEGRFNTSDQPEPDGATPGVRSRSWIDGSGVDASPRFDAAGNLIDDGKRFIFEYDARNQLTNVYRRVPGVEGGPASRGARYGQFTYNGLGWRTSAVYDREFNGSETDDNRFDNDALEIYAYDEQWRIVAVYRQGPVDSGTGARPPPVLDERYFYRGEALPGFGPAGSTRDVPFDQPVMRLRSPQHDGVLSECLWYVQDARGNIIGLMQVMPGPGPGGGDLLNSASFGGTLDQGDMPENGGGEGGGTGSENGGSAGRGVSGRGTGSRGESSSGTSTMPAPTLIFPSATLEADPYRVSFFVEQYRYTPYGEPVCFALADINKDARVDLDDLAAFGIAYGNGFIKRPAPPSGQPVGSGDRRADVNGNGVLEEDSNFLHEPLTVIGPWSASDRDLFNGHWARSVAYHGGVGSDVGGFVGDGDLLMALRGAVGGPGGGYASTGGTGGFGEGDDEHGADQTVGGLAILSQPDTQRYAPAPSGTTHSATWAAARKARRPEGLLPSGRSGNSHAGGRVMASAGGLAPVTQARRRRAASRPPRPRRAVAPGAGTNDLFLLMRTD